MNILEHANTIVFERKEEKEREYGPFKDGMQKAADIAKLILGKEITSDDMYICMIALKLSRQSYNHKYDNILDAICYLASYEQTKTKIENKQHVTK